MNELVVELRDRTGKEGAAAARRNGNIPAILYGADGPATALAINDRTFQKFIHGTGNRSSLVALNVTKPGSGEKPQTEHAIIKAIQRHPVVENITHVDFLRVSLKEVLTVEIPVEITGSSPGVKFGGVMQQAARQVQVRCLPTNIPEAAVADISAMEIGNVLTAADLKIPEGVELITDPNQAILSIVVVKVEEEAAAAVEPGAEVADVAAQPEVIGEKEREERRAKKEEGKEAREKEKADIKEQRAKEAK